MLESDILNSENKREGMKYITRAVYDIIKEKKECTYNQIVKEIDTKNSETKIRRIYDVLNVLRAVNLIDKRGKTYIFIEEKNDITKKIEEREKLTLMKNTFKYITTKNKQSSHIGSEEKLYLPFMLVFTDKNSEIHCDTNEERDYFSFKSNKPLVIMEDLHCLKILQENDLYVYEENKPNKRPKTNANIMNGLLDELMF